MAYNSKQIQELMASGADAMNNMFDVYINFPTVLDSDGTKQNSARVRIKDSFQPPAPETGTYTISYHGVEITRPSTTMTLDRKLSLKFRLDAKYELYETFIKWHNYVTDPNLGSFADNVNDSMLGTITVRQLAGEYLAPGTTGMAGLLGSADEVQQGNIVTPEWKFKGVWVSKVDTPSFTAGKDGQNMEFGVEFYFDDIEYPFYTNNGPFKSTSAAV